MNTKNIITALIVSFVALVGIAMLLFRQGEVVDQAPPVPADVVGEARYVKGEGDITIVEFSDFQCPACKAARLVVDQILESYEGQVRFIYRHYPLISIHANAEEAARAAEAAHMQGKFFEYHDMLFDKQDSWSSERNPEAIFVEYARDLGLDTDQFSEDYQSSEVRDVVQNDLVMASSLKLQGTPTFFLNGVQVETQELSSSIDALISVE